MRRVPAVFLLLSISFISGLSASHKHRTRERQSQSPAGVFDFYLLVLSWSPEFCHSKPDAAQCAAHKGFVVHGLWPQNNDGSWPQNCQTTQPAPKHPASITDIMPAEIVNHEWQRHGTCSGLSGDDYLSLIRKAYEAIKIPQPFVSPSSSVTMRPNELKQDFVKADRDLAPEDIAVQVRGGYLNAVEFCISKNSPATPIACSNVRDARPSSFVVPPVR